MLVLSRADVEAVLDLDRLVEVVATAMVDLSRGRASMPPWAAASVLTATPSWRPCLRFYPRPGR